MISLNKISIPNWISCHTNFFDKEESRTYISNEKNHEYIRYILPKGTSFAGLTQEDCYLLASHINSTPRISLNNDSPYDSAFKFIGEDNINKFHIVKIDYDDIDLSPRLLKK